MMNRILKTRAVTKFNVALIVVTSSLLTTSVNAQSLSDVKWKDQQHVKNLFGEPQNIRGPIGTHASYSLWEYSEFTVAFSNQKAFHLFRKDGASRPTLNDKPR